MQKLLLFGLAGFIAQLVDGSLGMGYGLTSSTLLIGLGVTPAVASASIHFAEIATTAASGTAHFRFGNVDVALLRRMAGPGALGAFFGAITLGLIPAALIKPFVSLFLLALGVYVTARVIIARRPGDDRARLPAWKTIPLALVAGFFDSMGGGGWGPIATPTLMAQSDLAPRRVIGTVDATEFAVTVAGALGFALVLGLHGINWTWVAIFAGSGLLAAPLAAFTVRLLPSQILGAVVGGAIILTNAHTILDAWDIGPSIHDPILLAGLVAWLGLLAVTIRRHWLTRDALADY